MHSLLRRQLERQGLRTDATPEEWQRLLEVVDQAYLQFDDDRAMLERSLELSSQELLQANSDMRTLFKALPDLLFRLDSKGTILEHKGATEADLVLPAAQLVGRRIQDIPEPELARRFAKALTELQSTGRPVQLEYSLTLRGTEHFFEARLVPALGDQSLVIVRNITARRRAEAEQRESEQSLQSLVDCMGDGVGFVDAAETFRFANRGAEEIFGVPAGTLVGRNLREFLGPEQFTRILAETEARRRGTRGTYEFDLVQPNGGMRHVEIVVTPRYDAQGRYAGACGVFRDVTDRVLAQQRLAHSQKIESVGRLAGGVAHDFNNLLTCICGNVDMVLLDLPEDSPLRELLDEANEAARRAVLLTRKLLSFSRQQVLQPRPLKLDVLVEELHRMLARLIGEDIHIVTALEPSIDLVRADQALLEQLLVNLAVNARDAMPDGGTLRIAVANVDISPERARTLTPQRSPGRYVQLTVTDTGTGMTPEVQSHLFEPFFTTKPLGKGTGLGLSMVYGTVEQHGGLVEVDSKVGVGTTFTIYLPAIGGELAANTSPVTEALIGGAATILLVEDEDGVRSFALRLLQRLGYRVFAASNGEEALRLAEKHKDSIDLVFTDVVMPGMNGRQLAERLRANQPQLKVLFASGYDQDVLDHHGVLGEELHFIAKPYSPTDLSRKLRDLLGR